jgi:hypothetical protein
MVTFVLVFLGLGLVLLPFALAVVAACMASSRFSQQEDNASESV